MKWISVKDELPHEEQIIAFTVKTRCYPFAGIFKKGRFYESLDDWYFCGEEIIYWMPLPEVPNEMD